MPSRTPESGDWLLQEAPLPGYRHHTKLCLSNILTSFLLPGDSHHAQPLPGVGMGPLRPSAFYSDWPGFAYHLCHHRLCDLGPFAFLLSPRSPEALSGLAVPCSGCDFFFFFSK